MLISLHIHHHISSFGWKANIGYVRQSFWETLKLSSCKRHFYILPVFYLFSSRLYSNLPPSKAALNGRKLFWWWTQSGGVCFQKRAKASILGSAGEEVQGRCSGSDRMICSKYENIQNFESSCWKSSHPLWPNGRGGGGWCAVGWDACENLLIYLGSGSPSTTSDNCLISALAPNLHQLRSGARAADE